MNQSSVPRMAHLQLDKNLNQIKKNHLHVCVQTAMVTHFATHNIYLTLLLMILYLIALRFE